MALMSLRSRSHVKTSMVLTRDDHLFIHNYIRSLLNNILRPDFKKLINGPDEALYICLCYLYIAYLYMFVLYDNYII